jgi:hypothetical protein
MSFKRVLCVASFSSAVAVSLYGAGCSSSSPAGGGKDGGGSDSVVMKDTGGMKDSGPETLPDVSSGDTSTGGCTAATVTVTPTLHQDPPSSDCTPAIVDQILYTCFNASPDASMSACMSLIAMPAYSTCLGCMQDESVTPAMDQTASATWGAIIFLSASMGNVGFYNLGGCVAALDPSSAGQACATALEANVECLLSSCSSCSFSSLDAGIADFEACEGEAEPMTGTGPCTATGMAITTACASETKDSGAGPGQACFQAVETLETMGSTDPEILAALKVLFGSICAPGLVDGG